jgi:hypothetical protein
MSQQIANLHPLNNNWNTDFDSTNISSGLWKDLSNNIIDWILNYHGDINDDPIYNGFSINYRQIFYQVIRNNSSITVKIVTDIYPSDVTPEPLSLYIFNGQSQIQNIPIQWVISNDNITGSPNTQYTYTYTLENVVSNTFYDFYILDNVFTDKISGIKVQSLSQETGQTDISYNGITYKYNKPIISTNAADFSSSTIFLIPRKTSQQLDSIENPIEGEIIYDTTVKTIKMYVNSQWVSIGLTGTFI